MTLAVAFLGACGGIAPLQERSAECDPGLGVDACVDPFVCQPDGETSSCKLLRAQQLAEPCDPTHGIDACGATLVCAALDGRAVPTCYPERSRPDGSTCSTDELCASRSCNADAGKCRATTGSACDAAVGCAADVSGAPVVCDAPPGFAGPLCHRASQAKGAPCSYDFECASTNCGIGGQVCL